VVREDTDLRVFCQWQKLCPPANLTKSDIQSNRTNHLEETTKAKSQ